MQTVHLAPSQQSPNCAHTAQVREVAPNSEGCEACPAKGDTRVHLRVCLTCGHVGRDSSKNKHATAHFHGTRHPIIRSLEPGETRVSCYEGARL